MDETETRSVTSKKEQGQYPAILTEQTWSIKDLVFGFWGNFFLPDKMGSPAWVGHSIAPKNR